MRPMQWLWLLIVSPLVSACKNQTLAERTFCLDDADYRVVAGVSLVNMVLAHVVAVAAIWRFVVVLRFKRSRGPSSSCCSSVFDTQFTALTLLFACALCGLPSTNVFLGGAVGLAAFVAEIMLLLDGWTVIILYFAKIVAKFHPPTATVIRALLAALSLFTVLACISVVGMLASFGNSDRVLAFFTLSNFNFAIYSGFLAIVISVYAALVLGEHIGDTPEDLAKKARLLRTIRMVQGAVCLEILLYAVSFGFEETAVSKTALSLVYRIIACVGTTAGVFLMGQVPKEVFPDDASTTGRPAGASPGTGTRKLLMTMSSDEAMAVRLASVAGSPATPPTPSRGIHTATELQSLQLRDPAP